MFVLILTERKIERLKLNYLGTYFQHINAALYSTSYFIELFDMIVINRNHLYNGRRDPRHIYFVLLSACLKPLSHFLRLQAKISTLIT